MYKIAKTTIYNIDNYVVYRSYMCKFEIKISMLWWINNVNSVVCSTFNVKCSWDGKLGGRNCSCAWSFWCSELCNIDQTVTVQRGSVLGAVPPLPIGRVRSLLRAPTRRGHHPSCLKKKKKKKKLTCHSRARDRSRLMFAAECRWS